MFRRLRENGPALLVPLAWGFTASARTGLLGERPVLIAHAVMCTLLAAFAVLSWSEMAEGVLLAWRRVIVVGFLITLAGLVGVLAEPNVRPLLWVSVLGWMVLPAVGFTYTAPRVERYTDAYRAGAALSVVGALTYVFGPAVGPSGELLGIALVGVGQTAGILAATLDNSAQGE